jgi:hypothetical protein
MARVSDRLVKSSDESLRSSEMGTGTGRDRVERRVRKVLSWRRWGERIGMSRRRRRWPSNAEANDLCIVISLQRSDNLQRRGIGNKQL